MFPRSFLLAAGLAFLLITLAVVVAEGDDMADAYKMLQMLDRYYSQVGRPRLARREAGGARIGPEGDEEEPNLTRAVRLLQLHNLDKFYSHHTRPRFGKRAVGHAPWEKDNPIEAERPDYWVPLPRRR